MRDKHPNKQLKIEKLSQWKLEAESRNFSPQWRLTSDALLRACCTQLGRRGSDPTSSQSLEDV